MVVLSDTQYFDIDFSLLELLLSFAGTQTETLSKAITSSLHPHHLSSDRDTDKSLSLKEKSISFSLDPSVACCKVTGMNSLGALLDAWRFLSLLPLLAQLFISSFQKLLCQAQSGFGQHLV